MSHLDRHRLAQGLRHQTAMTVRRVGLEAEQADPPPAPDDVGQSLQLGAGLVSPEVLEIDRPHLLVPPRAGRRPAGSRGAQPAQVEVVDPRAAQVGGEGGLGESRTARAGDRPHVDQ